MAMKDPSKGYILMVAPHYYGTGPELQGNFEPLTTMGPLEHNHLAPAFDKHRDHLGWMCPKGEFKRFSQTGLACINPSNFSGLVDFHRELLMTLPGTERSMFTIEWHTPTPNNGVRKTDISFGLKSIDIWP